MKNADMPINGELQQVGDIAIKEGGLTKREHFAAMAMQGLLAADTGFNIHQNDCACIAVTHADSLLAELERAS